MGLRWKQPMPQDAYWKLEYVRLARETGWHWDYIESLDLEWWRDWLGVRDGEIKASPNWMG